MDPQATAGRIVHYSMPGGQKRAAIVNADTPDDGTASLTVFMDTGPQPLHGVPYSEVEGIVGSWNWMPYQREKAETARGNVSESAEPAEADSPRYGADRDVETPAGSVEPGEGVQSDPVAGAAAGVEEAGGTTAAPGDEKPVLDSEAPKVTPE